MAQYVYREEPYRRFNAFTKMMLYVIIAQACWMIASYTWGGELYFRYGYNSVHIFPKITINLSFTMPWWTDYFAPLLALIFLNHKDIDFNDEEVSHALIVTLLTFLPSLTILGITWVAGCSPISLTYLLCVLVYGFIGLFFGIKDKRRFGDDGDALKAALKSTPYFSVIIGIIYGFLYGIAAILLLGFFHISVSLITIVSISKKPPPDLKEHTTDSKTKNETQRTLDIE